SEWKKVVLAAFCLLVSASSAVACPLCYEVARQWITIGLQIDMADRVVLATQAAVQGQYQIVDVIKGYDRIGAPITDPIIRNDSKGTPPLPFRLEGGRTRLFVRDGPTSKWIDLGAISVKNADWLRQLVATLSIAGSRPPPGWPQSMQTSFDLSDA